MGKKDWESLTIAWDWLNAYRANKELDGEFMGEVFHNQTDVLPNSLVDAWEESVTIEA